MMTEDRLYWATMLTVLRESLLAVEDKKEKEFGAKTGVWIEELVPLAPAGFISGSKEPPASSDAAGAATPPPPPRQRDPRLPPRRQPAAQPAAGSAGSAEIGSIVLNCRGVNLSRVKADARPDAHTVIAEGLAEELRTRTNHFVPDATKVTGEILGADGTNLTFTFSVTAKLARPVKL
jgi:hypothetical protein